MASASAADKEREQELLRAKLEEKQAFVKKLMFNPHALINTKNLVWCEDTDEKFKRPSNVFGPPVFDEKETVYSWR